VRLAACEAAWRSACWCSGLRVSVVQHEHRQHRRQEAVARVAYAHAGEWIYRYAGGADGEWGTDGLGRTGPPLGQRGRDRTTRRAARGCACACRRDAGPHFTGAGVLLARCANLTNTPVTPPPCCIWPSRALRQALSIFGDHRSDVGWPTAERLRPCSARARAEAATFDRDRTAAAAPGSPLPASSTALRLHGIQRGADR